MWLFKMLVYQCDAYWRITHSKIIKAYLMWTCMAQSTTFSLLWTVWWSIGAVMLWESPVHQQSCPLPIGLHMLQQRVGLLGWWTRWEQNLNLLIFQSPIYFLGILKLTYPIMLWAIKWGNLSIQETKTFKTEWMLNHLPSKQWERFIIRRRRPRSVSNGSLCHLHLL